MAHWAQTVQTTGFMLNTGFPSGSLELHTARATQRPPMWFVPKKTLGTESLTSLAGGQHFTWLSQLGAGGSKPLLCDAEGRAPLEACPWFPWTSPRVPLLSGDCDLHPFAVINQSHEYDYTLSPVGPPANHQNWRWSWGPLTHPLSHNSQKWLHRLPNVPVEGQNQPPSPAENHQPGHTWPK